MPSASAEESAPWTGVKVSWPAVSTIVAPSGTGIVGVSLAPVIVIVTVPVAVSAPSEAVTVKASVALADRALTAASSGSYVQPPPAAVTVRVP